MNIDIKVTDHSEEFFAALDEAIETALQECGMQAEGFAKNELSNTPKRIDTGLLRNSITWALGGKPTNIKSYHASNGSARNAKGERIGASSANAGSVKVGRYGGQAPADDPDKPAVWIGTNVEYSTYVHNGTMKMAANPFLKNAITRHPDVFKAIIEQYLKG